MKLILSPTKTMAFDIPETGVAQSTPPFESEAMDLNRELAKIDREKIQALFKTSDALTQKTLDQIRGFDRAASAPALFVFRGEAFKTLNPQDLSREDLTFASEHLWILSGLYGILTPMDGVRPYRLDLTTPLKPEGKSLTAFWKKRVVPWAGERLSPEEPILNLASDEYAALFRRSTLTDRMITLQFRQREADRLKNNSVRAKQARGLFARAVIEDKIQNPDTLKDLCLDGYAYSGQSSSPAEWFFIR